MISSIDGRICYTREILEQKLGYILHNSVSEKWNLVKDFVDYEHISASFYEKGVHRHFKVTQYQNLTHPLLPQSPPASDSEEVE